MSIREELEDAFKLVCFQLVYYLVSCIPSKPKGKKLLLVKTDEIGDYMLTRNFLGKFRESSLYKDHEITFIGSGIYRDIFEAFDSCVADRVIWLDKKKFRRNLLYRFAVLKEVRKSGFSDAVNLVYSRSFRVDDVLIAVSTSREKKAMKTGHPPAYRVERMLTPRDIYQQLVDPGEQSLFDAYKNARFIGEISETRIGPVSVNLEPVADTGIFSLPASYFVVFPGSGNKARNWPIQHFCEVADFISREYGLEPVVCGSNADKPEAGQFVRAFGHPVTDITGRTSLPQFLAVLKTAKCLVSVDTSAVHLAAAVRCPVFGLFSGLYYGRFAPYPKEIAPDFVAIYPDEIDEQIRMHSLPDTNDIPIGLLRKIPPEKVINSIRKNFRPK